MSRRAMKRGTMTAAAAALLAALCPGVAEAEVSFAAGGSYSTYESDTSRESGSQFFTPITLSSESKNGLFGGVNTGYVVSTHQPAVEGGDETTVSTFVDTQISLFYTRPFYNGCIRLGSGFNLPTGQSALSAAERSTIADPQYGEILPVSSYGEGTNANPGFSLTLPLGRRLTVGLGGSYHLRGAYDPTSGIQGDDIDPGDEAMGKFSLEWRGESLRLLGGLRYLYVAADEVGGVETFAEGDSISGNATVEYRTGPWFLILEGAYSTWATSESAEGEGGLELEEYLRYGDEAHLKATAQYRLTPKMVLSVIGRGHWVQPNEYPVGSALYDSGRTALEGVVGFFYQLFPGIYLKGTASYQQVREPADAALDEDTTYSGPKVSLNLVTWFDKGKKK